MNKIEMQKYLNERINNKIYSKIHYHKHEVKYYFRSRHIGLANLDTEQVYSLVYGAIRDLRLWQEIKRRIQ
tara:strand:- start:718 stop:930 length:213 start_codon:yes stop_codon:yes gene_type:complete